MLKRQYTLRRTDTAIETWDYRSLEDEQQAPCPSGRPVDHYMPTEHKYSKKELSDRLVYAEAKRWSEAHKRQPTPLPLPLGTERCIRQWFQLVDDNGSGRLDAAELEYALQASGIPADGDAIKEIIRLFDFDHDGEINWKEFHHFLVHEMMANKDPLGTDYLLPSGTSMPFGSMIGAIRRRKMLSDVERGGVARGFWVAEGPDFLRCLLESEHFAFQKEETSNDLLHRIMEFKPAEFRAADPEALAEHKRRIERLKMFLQRTSSQGGGATDDDRDSEDVSDDDQKRPCSRGDCGGGRGSHGCAVPPPSSASHAKFYGAPTAGKIANAVAANAWRRRQSRTADGGSPSRNGSRRSSSTNGEKLMPSRSRSCTGCSSASGRGGVAEEDSSRKGSSIGGRSRHSSRAGDEGAACGGGAGTPRQLWPEASSVGNYSLQMAAECGRRPNRAQVRFAAAMAAAEAAFATEEQQQQRQHQDEQQGDGSNGSEGGDNGHEPSNGTTFMTEVPRVGLAHATAEGATAAAAASSTEAASVPRAAVAAEALTAAAQTVAMRHLDERLNRHHERCRSPRPRLCKSPVALSSTKAKSQWLPVVSPIHLSDTAEVLTVATPPPSPPPSSLSSSSAWLLLMAEKEREMGATSSSRAGGGAAPAAESGVERRELGRPGAQLQREVTLRSLVGSPREAAAAAASAGVGLRKLTAAAAAVMEDDEVVETADGTGGGNDNAHGAHDDAELEASASDVSLSPPRSPFIADLAGPPFLSSRNGKTSHAVNDSAQASEAADNASRPASCPCPLAAPLFALRERHTADQHFAGPYSARLAGSAAYSAHTAACRQAKSARLGFRSARSTGDGDAWRDGSPLRASLGGVCAIPDSASASAAMSAVASASAFHRESARVDATPPRGAAAAVAGGFCSINAATGSLSHNAAPHGEHGGMAQGPSSRPTSQRHPHPPSSPPSRACSGRAAAATKAADIRHYAWSLKHNGWSLHGSFSPHPPSSPSPARQHDSQSEGATAALGGGRGGQGHRPTHGSADSPVPADRSAAGDVARPMPQTRLTPPSPPRLPSRPATPQGQHGPQGAGLAAAPSLMVLPSPRSSSSAASSVASRDSAFRRSFDVSELRHGGSMLLGAEAQASQPKGPCRDAAVPGIYGRLMRSCLTESMRGSGRQPSSLTAREKAVAVAAARLGGGKY